MRSHDASFRHRHDPSRDARGFTLVELLITLTVLIVVMGTVTTMLYLSSKSKTATQHRMESAQGARAALDMLAEDLRSAGYGADIDWSSPQPQIAYIDSTQVLINANLSPWPDTSSVTQPTTWTTLPGAPSDHGRSRRISALPRARRRRAPS